MSAFEGKADLTFHCEMSVDPNVGDLLHNARDGLRARYWLSPQIGHDATHHLLALLHGMLFSSLPPRLEGDGLVLTREAVVMALQSPSAKIWVNEGQLRSRGKSLEVPRWAANEGEEGNPCLWRWTPQATLFEIKSAWVTAGGAEWVPDNKKERDPSLGLFVSISFARPPSA